MFYLTSTRHHELSSDDFFALACGMPSAFYCSYVVRYTKVSPIQLEICRRKSLLSAALPTVLGGSLGSTESPTFIELRRRGDTSNVQPCPKQESRFRLPQAQAACGVCHILKFYFNQMIFSSSLGPGRYGTLCEMQSLIYLVVALECLASARHASPS